MISKVNEQDLEILKKSIIKGMLDKKASNITSIDLRKGNNSLADLLLFATVHQIDKWKP